MVIRSSIALLILMLAISLPARAEDLGVIGPTYDIIERDLIEVLQDKFRHMEKTGELSRLQNEYKRKVIEGIEKPRPVPGVKPTEVARTFYIDPTYTLERNILDEKGHILFTAGTKVNPFDYDRMSKVLLFFDGRDKKQTEFALRVIKETKQEVKPILVAGEPMNLMRKWKRPVYYDQGGALTRRFSISQSPAVVRQEDKRLRIDEIKL